MASTSTPQRPINSGFDAQSTANDVLDGIDLSGKLAIVTGGYSGLGLETVRSLARAGARVIVPARRADAAREAVTGIDGAEVARLDLADLADVRAFARAVLDSGRGVDLLINNAGIMACPETRVGPGWEAQFAVNHLGHHALTNLLWPALARGGARGGARVVAVSSAGHQDSGMRWDDVQFTRGYDKWLAYGQAKTANALFALHLDTLGRPHGVRAFSLHPGGILTPLQRHLAQAEMVDAGWIDEQGNVTNPTFKTPEQGAATQVWAATSPRLADRGGVYCEDCDIAPPAGPAPVGGGLVPGVAAHACDPEQAARLWDLSAELTGLNAFATAGR
ncbi:SDR family NAD(P)-dependent oxidoreductase [Streptomyces sp. MP131-18]|uniref:SDR family NAD(P)-dependent oxidoreductase n=1 Tax=Streptomyces sp. MP131-18 TaxID=1857892 RepID=UPI00097C03D2|nr:SDR family NAD(P)-dependent oxidoreductase [Streptomyces sp. MP131-18]ONK13658.1 Rhamnolipids biosynthesis 3-oxoacyl-[acyl-carrier-protein] reductase [Streptomyces sp. MP131-18]